MATTSFRFDLLPHHITTQILEYLPVKSLYIVASTSRALRQIVADNAHLKYASNTGQRYRNPVANQTYAVHDAWKYILFLYGLPVKGPIIRTRDEKGNIRCDYDLRDTCLASEPAVHPPLTSFYLHITGVGTSLSWPEVYLVEGQDGPVTLWDVTCAVKRDLARLDRFADVSVWPSTGGLAPSGIAVYTNFSWRWGTTFSVRGLL
jgi:F-box-like